MAYVQITLEVPKLNKITFTGQIKGIFKETTKDNKVITEISFHKNCKYIDDNLNLWVITSLEIHKINEDLIIYHVNVEIEGENILTSGRKLKAEQVKFIDKPSIY